MSFFQKQVIHMILKQLKCYSDISGATYKRQTPFGEQISWDKEVVYRECNESIVLECHLKISQREVLHITFSCDNLQLLHTFSIKQNGHWGFKGL